MTTPTGRLLMYHILHLLEFDSERKCMTVIVKEDWSGRVLLYSKGADSSIFGNLAHPDTGVLECDSGEFGEGGDGGNRRELTEQHLTVYAKEGLRTLCMARRVRNTLLWYPTLFCIHTACGLVLDWCACVHCVCALCAACHVCVLCALCVCCMPCVCVCAGVGARRLC